MTIVTSTKSRFYSGYSVRKVLMVLFILIEIIGLVSVVRLERKEFGLILEINLKRMKRTEIDICGHCLIRIPLIEK